MLLLAIPALGAAAQKAPSQGAQFRHWLVHSLKSGYRDDADFQNLLYGYALVDLNGDGRNEAVVWARDANCGAGGCDLEIFTHTKSGWREFSSTTITRPPIMLLAQHHHGWRDLAAWAAGGGIKRPYEERLRFNGTKYEAVEPTDWTGVNPQPLRLHGRTLIRDATIPLFPNKCHRTEEATSVFGPMPIKSGKPGSC
jgi:hypothetical protein